MTATRAAPLPDGGTAEMAPARRWVDAPRRPPSLLAALRNWRVTRDGKVFFFLTFCVGFAAVNTGNNLLYLVLGLLLSVIILSGLLSDLSLRGLGFQRRLPKRAFAGHTALIEIEVRNTKRWVPSYSIEVEDKLENRRTDKRCYFLKVNPGGRQTAAYRRTPPVRGRERYLSLRVATRFPFGLFEKWYEVELTDSQLVYPSLQQGRRSAAVPRAPDGQTPTQQRGEGDVEGLRDLHSGAPVRDIDWKKSASLGRLVARERRREGAPTLRLFLRNKPLEQESAEHTSARVEAELRRLAWQALEALRAGTCVDLVVEAPPEGRTTQTRITPGPEAPERLLRLLALLPPLPVVPEGSA